ncbi:hypothetical protein GJ744_008731 [Endocarpon pusillum]|uniref:Uncharacterized protein n=1 Tax=Endocarpon pusillum TaxID=364733 RepID=A0A8H7ASD2_9EURO|nr:hypothetical protein GJ744_008731 [Endocarpon pusillum]
MSVRSNTKERERGEGLRKAPPPPQTDPLTWICCACNIGLAVIASQYRNQHRKTHSEELKHELRWQLEGNWPGSFLDPGPVVFLCVSVAWGIVTIYILRRHEHHSYQNHFVAVGIAISALVGVLSLVSNELPSHLAVTYTPLWISFVMVLSLMLHCLLAGR